MTEPNEIDMSAADILPTTYLEEEWVRAVNSRASDHNLPLAIDITGPYDRGLVLDALRALVLRHETLRMAFRPQRDGVQRAVWPTVEPVLDTADLSGADERERIRRLNELILKEAKRPTDLTRPPLWRAVEVRLAPTHHVLLTIWHHVIFDGWSSRVFFRDLTSLYAGALRRDQPKLPESEIHLADYAAWERELKMPDAAAAYWRTVLPGEPARLPVEDDGRDPQIMAGRPYPVIPADRVKRFEEIARDQGVTLASVLRSVVLTALRPYLPEQLVIGCVHGNRDKPELQPIIGLLSDHLPVKIDLSGKPTFAELTARVHDAVRTARRHQAPAGLIINSVAPPPGGGQMFDISINNMRHAAPLTEAVTAPDGSTTTFAVRDDIPATELWPRIRRPFSGGVRLGYQLRHNAAGDLTGEIWGHLPTFRTATLDMLGRALARTAERIASDPRQPVETYAPHRQRSRISELR